MSYIDGANDRMLLDEGPVEACGEMNACEQAMYMEQLLRSQLQRNDATIRGFATGLDVMADPVIVDLLDGNERLLGGQDSDGQ